jgi:hypothetical protein
MVACLGLVYLALKSGLAMRRLRQRAGSRDFALLRRHLAMAKPGVALAVLGFVGGGVSSVTLRGWELLESFHGIAGAVVVILFSVTAVFGRRAERGEGDPAVHGLLGVFAVLIASLAAVAGFVLLP